MPCCTYINGVIDENEEDSMKMIEFNGSFHSLQLRDKIYTIQLSFTHCAKEPAKNIFL